MERPSGHEERWDPTIRNGPLPPFVQALVLMGVHPGLILPQAEALGAGPAELLWIATILIPTTDPVPAMALALGSIQRWPALRRQALMLGTSLLTRLVRFFVLGNGAWFPCNQDETKAWLPDDAQWAVIRIRALRRLGYPGQCIPACAIPVVPDAPGLPEPDAWAWMDAGNGLVASNLEIQGGASRAREWGPLLVARILLRDCRVPAILHRPATWLPSGQASVRLFRVGGLREFTDGCRSSSLIAVGCPDLVKLRATPRALVAKGCPRLTGVTFGVGGLLHLERCPGIRSLVPAVSAQSMTPRGMKRGTPAITCQSLLLSHCPNLGRLPRRLRVLKNMTLHRMGPITRWPVHFNVDGDLRIRDCPLIEELPRVEVGGSLRVDGRSGLRHLLPGSIFGGDLDLRACAFLEGLPQDLSIGGTLLLPRHLGIDE